jgi:hypothetical protein
MYNEDIIEEDAILSWEDEKKGADEADKVFVNQAQPLIQVSIFVYFCTRTKLILCYLHLLNYPMRCITFLCKSFIYSCL